MGLIREENEENIFDLGQAEH